MKFKKLSEVKVKDKKVLLRIDINSPVINGKIEDNPRLQECAHTIKYLIKNKAKLVIIAHQGRKGDRDFVSLKQHASLLTKHSKIKITYIDSLFEATASRAIENLKSGSALLLKNVRSYDDELDINKKDNKFSEFSKQFDLFVNDAFSVCHRKQSSLMIPPKYITSCIGLALEKEISALDKFSIKNKPTLYLLGGAKVDD
ncbi:MAG: phosphoglycerate kinase, partial [archaeon]